MDSPHSEPVEQGKTDTKLGMGGGRFGTTARKVDGGHIINGRKSFTGLDLSSDLERRGDWRRFARCRRH